MQTIPNSTLYLCKDVDLDPNYNYTIDFDNITAQANYFDSKIATEFEINEGYSYVRDTQALKIQANIDDLLGINYLFYNNGNKRYYAFITKKEYISSTCTSLSFKLDVLQSFMFDYEIDESFIEREHQDRYNNLGKPIFNRESEQLERGEQYVRKTTNIVDDNVPSVITEFFGNKWNKEFFLYWAIVVTSEPLADNVFTNAGIRQSASITEINGIPTGTYTYVSPIFRHVSGLATSNAYSFGIKPTGTDSITFGSLNSSVLDYITQDPRVISVNISRYCPFEYTATYERQTTPLTIHTFWLSADTNHNQALGGLRYSNVQYKDEGGNTIVGGLFNIAHITSDIYKNLNIARDFTIDITDLNINNAKSKNFEPKLLTNDYNYFELEYSNQNVKLQNENLTNGTFGARYLPSFSAKNGVAVIPLNYKDQSLAITDMMTFDSSTNEIPLRTDAWLTYLSQNKNSMITGYKVASMKATASAVSSVAGGIIGGLLTGNILGSIAGTGAGIANTAVNYTADIMQRNAQINDIKNTPDKVARTTLDVVLDDVIDDIYIRVNEYGIVEQFEDKVFNYFYHFGYRYNNFKKPNTRSRYYFNYIKTLGVNIKTNIDADFRAEIANAYNNGITIWHYRNANTFKGVNNFDYENVELNLMEV